MLNGIGTGALPDLVMSTVLGGMFSTYERTNVAWPMQALPITGADSKTLTDSVSEGVTSLDAAIGNALTKIGPNEHVTVVGLSAGSLVADDELRKLLTSANAPDKSKLTFVVVADSSRIPINDNRLDPIVGYQYRPPVQTKYDTLVVAAEYDGFADFPDRPWNVVAVVNAIAGEIMTHVPSMFTDLSTVQAQNITVTTNSLGGVTTRYFVPAAYLPLVQLFPFLASQESALRKVVEAGYARNDSKPAGAAAAVAAPSAVSPTPATVTNVAPVTVAAPVSPAAEAVSATPVSKTQAPRPAAAIPADPTGGSSAPALTPPTGRASTQDNTEAPHPSAHRGPAARSDDTRSQTAKPAAAARTASRRSA